MGEVRTRLPDRRRTVTTIAPWKGREWLIGVGFDEAGKVREVFGDGPKSGEDMEGLLDDGCILLSLLLQSGHEIGGLADTLGRESVDPADPMTGRRPPASPIGAIAATAAELQREAAGAVLEAEAARIARVGR